ncbi:unnamed protein product [Heligmosomoides polygyrus]|uniref:HTH_48 domain-containing protein n=1 Tax=Heligmosomoides polygyrus TaxID=6339 RepID=A0A183FR94_HELPZ|nr:unnamed protein product [Heligmosomoides polygyrus]
MSACARVVIHLLTLKCGPPLDKEPSTEEIKLAERTISTLKDFEAHQLEVDEGVVVKNPLLYGSSSSKSKCCVRDGEEEEALRSALLLNTTLVDLQTRSIVFTAKDHAPSRATCFIWYRKFNNGDEALKEHRRARRPPITTRKGGS